MIADLMGLPIIEQDTNDPRRNNPQRRILFELELGENEKADCSGCFYSLRDDCDLDRAYRFVL